MEVSMRIEKKTLNDALRVLGKVVCQTSPVELYWSVRFVGDENGIQAMATDGVETVSVILDVFAETEVDFCVPFKKLKKLVRTNRRWNKQNLIRKPCPPCKRRLYKVFSTAIYWNRARWQLFPNWHIKSSRNEPSSSGHWALSTSLRTSSKPSSTAKNPQHSLSPSSAKVSPKTGTSSGNCLGWSEICTLISKE